MLFFAKLSPSGGEGKVYYEIRDDYISEVLLTIVNISAIFKIYHQRKEKNHVYPFRSAIVLCWNICVVAALLRTCLAGLISKVKKDSPDTAPRFDPGLGKEAPK